MAGQIIKRGDKRWLVRVFNGREADGKRRYFNKTIHGTKKDAQKWLTAAVRDQDMGVFVEPASMPLADYLDRWLLTVKHRVRERTFDSYEWLLEKYVRPTLCQKRLCDLKAVEVQKVYNSLTEDKKLSAKTVRHVHQVLSSALSQAVKWRLVVQNPCSLCELPRRVRKEMLCLSADETKLFLEKAREWYSAFLLALETGMRPEEYLGLKWSDIDFDRGLVTVRRALIWLKGGGWRFEEPKTSQSRRSMPVTSSALAALKRHKVDQAEHILKHGADYQKHDLVFASETGTPLLWAEPSQSSFQEDSRTRRTAKGAEAL